MEFVYTAHAEENISERKLSKTLIESVVLRPEKVTASRLGRAIAHKVIDGKLLRVVYEERQSAYIII